MKKTYIRPELTVDEISNPCLMAVTQIPQGGNAYKEGDPVLCKEGVLWSDEEDYYDEQSIPLE